MNIIQLCISAYLVIGLLAAATYFVVLDRVAPGHDMSRRDFWALILAWPVAAPFILARLI